MRKTWTKAGAGAWRTISVLLFLAVLVTPDMVDAQFGESTETLDIERLLDALSGEADLPPTTNVVTTSPSSEKMLVGDMLTLSASSDDPMDTFTWSTSVMAVVTVDSSGEVTAVMLGTATITATGSNSGLAGATTIDVVSAIIDVTPTGSTMLVGQTQAMTAISTNGSDTFSWTSSNTSVVSIDSSTGIASATDVGTATITATGSDSGENGTTTVSVITPTLTLGLGPCFITSLLQGTRYADKLDGIRAFRDTVLLESGLGCAVADAYYRLSPAAIRLLPGVARK